MTAARRGAPCRRSRSRDTRRHLRSSISTISLRSSATGKRAWSAADDLPQMLQSLPEITFLDSQHGFIDEPGQKIGDGPLAFLATSDGGNTWKDLHPQVS